MSVAAAPLRRKPDHRKEMVNQLLFGETVKVLREKGPLWVKIRGLHDGYEGWLTRTLLEETDEVSAGTRSLFVAADLLNQVSAGEKKLSIPVGSSLPFFENGTIRLGGTEYGFTGNYYKRDEQKPDAALIEKLALLWLHAPYLWGGRTPLGVDCSGFVQVVFKQAGIDLPRDAWQQAQEGRSVKAFRDKKPGDLAFFDRGEEIVHVGILLGEDRIIHASGKVRIDRLTKKGIILAETGERTLKLRALRRIYETD